MACDTVTCGGGDTALERTFPLCAQPERTKIEAKTGLRRVDGLVYDKGQSPTITGREHFDRAPNSEKFVVAEAIG